MYCKNPLPLDKSKCKSQALLFWTCKWSERKKGAKGQRSYRPDSLLAPKSLCGLFQYLPHTTLGASLQGGASGCPFPETREPTESTEENSGINKGEKWQQEQRELGQCAGIQITPLAIGSTAEATSNGTQLTHRGWLQILLNLKQAKQPLPKVFLEGEHNIENNLLLQVQQLSYLGTQPLLLDKADEGTSTLSH